MVMNRKPTRQEVLDNPSTHDLTKQILSMAEGKDKQETYYDILLALEVIKAEAKTN
jgi:hypothetical protein